MNATAREDKKNHILQTGIEVMYLHGYNGTGVKDIVDAAGIPKGSFYNYFQSKEEFALIALDQMFVSTSEKLCPSSENQPALKRLTHFFESNAQKAKEGGYLLGCFLGNMSQEMSDVNEPIRNKADLLMCKLTLLVEDCLRDAQLEGTLAKDRDIKQLAQFIFNAWEGTLMRMKSAKNYTAFDSFFTELPRLLKT